MAGLELYGRDYARLRYDVEFLEASERLLTAGLAFAAPAPSRADYCAARGEEALHFLLAVQDWKRQYVDAQVDSYEPPTAGEIAGAFYDFFRAEGVAEKLLPLLQISGQRHSRCHDEARLTMVRALALARFLDPEHWALIDWRIMGVIGYRTMTDLKQERIGSPADSIRQLFEPILYSDVEVALDFLQSYRCEDLPHAVDVELALFSISLDIWNAGQIAENLRRLA